MPVLRLRPWVPPVLVFLGLFTALTDGISTSLIIPLVQNQSASGGSGGLRFINVLFERFPAEQRLWWIGGSILLCVVLKNALSYSHSLLFQRVNASVTHRLRCGILHQLLNVSQGYLDAQESGKPLNTLLSETWRVSSAFALIAGEIINTCMILIFSILLLLISWKLTLIAAISVGLISRIIQWLTRNAKRLGREAMAANASFAERTLQIYYGLRLVRAFGREAHEENRFAAASLRVSTTFFQMDRASGLVGPTSEILTFLLLLGILLLARHSPDAMAASLTFLLVLYRLHPRIKQFNGDWAALQGLSASVEEVSSLLSETDKPYLRSGNRRLAALKNEITFENVSLHYESGKCAALESVNVSIRKGETTALVGPSGAGKSSLVSLLCRFYDPSAGRVLIDGIPLPNLDLVWWRNQIALVSQDIHLFNATVAENILYGKLDATRDELIEAARKARALELINELPAGFDTILGERGIRLSGGQRQRIALARAFIRDPQVLILDEATNSLDLISEQMVRDALEEFAKDRTMLIIAHRIGPIEHADHIVVLDSGRVSETGTLRQLLGRDGLFSRLYALQFRHRRQSGVLSLQTQSP